MNVTEPDCGLTIHFPCSSTTVFVGAPVLGSSNFVEVGSKVSPGGVGIVLIGFNLTGGLVVVGGVGVTRLVEDGVGVGVSDDNGFNWAGGRAFDVGAREGVGLGFGRSVGVESLEFPPPLPLPPPLFVGQRSVVNDLNSPKYEVGTLSTPTIR